MCSKVQHRVCLLRSWWKAKNETWTLSLVDGIIMGFWWILENFPLSKENQSHTEGGYRRQDRLQQTSSGSISVGKWLPYSVRIKFDHVKRSNQCTAFRCQSSQLLLTAWP
jgi:hypothetical protein